MFIRVLAHVVQRDKMYHMAVLKHYIIVGNRKYEYVLEPARTRTMLVCEGAGINERFDNSEIPQVLANLAKAIHTLQESTAEVQSEALRFRVTPKEREQIMQHAYNAGYDTVSAYVRDKVLGNN